MKFKHLFLVVPMILFVGITGLINTNKINACEDLTQKDFAEIKDDVFFYDQNHAQQVASFGKNPFKSGKIFDNYYYTIKNSTTQNLTPWCGHYIGARTISALNHLKTPMTIDQYMIEQNYYLHNYLAIDQDHANYVTSRAKVGSGATLFQDEQQVYQNHNLVVESIIKNQSEQIAFRVDELKKYVQRITINLAELKEKIDQGELIETDFQAFNQKTATDQIVSSQDGELHYCSIVGYGTDDSGHELLAISNPWTKHLIWIDSTQLLNNQPLDLNPKFHNGKYIIKKDDLKCWSELGKLCTGFIKKNPTAKTKNLAKITISRNSQGEIQAKMGDLTLSIISTKNIGGKQTYQIEFPRKMGQNGLANQEITYASFDLEKCAFGNVLDEIGNTGHFVLRPYNPVKTFHRGFNAKAQVKTEVRGCQLSLQESYTSLPAGVRASRLRWGSQLPLLMRDQYLKEVNRTHDLTQALSNGGKASFAINNTKNIVMMPYNAPFPYEYEYEDETFDGHLLKLTLDSETDKIKEPNQKIAEMQLQIEL